MDYTKVVITDQLIKFAVPDIDKLPNTKDMFYFITITTGEIEVFMEETDGQSGSFYGSCEKTSGKKKF